MQIQRLEPSLAHRDRTDPPTLVVLHATAGSTVRSSIDHLRGIGFSYHYIITRDRRDSARSDRADGTEPVIFHCVPNDKQAFHVASQVPPPAGAGSINRNSIGVSLGNIQRVRNPEAYPAPQLRALEELLGKLKRDVPTLRFSDDPRCLPTLELSRSTKNRRTRYRTAPRADVVATISSGYRSASPAPHARRLTGPAHVAAQRSHIAHQTRTFTPA